MKTLLLSALTAVLVLGGASSAAALGSHPRLLMTGAVKQELIAKMNANDASWTSLQTKANTMLAQNIVQYKYSTSSNWYNNAIFYQYDGRGWYEAAFTLSMAWQMTGDTAYANKAVALADEMVRAENDADNMPSATKSPLVLNRCYPARNVAPAMAVIYDWCYDRLGAQRKADMIAVMNKWFQFIRTGTSYSSTYQKDGYSTGNWFSSLMTSVAWMGYATHDDNANAALMESWARTRLDGTTSALLSASDYPQSNRKQAFTGPMKTSFGNRYGVSAASQGATGAPFKGGLYFQGWRFGNEDFSRMLDYMMIINSATGEDVIGQFQNDITSIFHALKHSTLPGGLLLDPVGEWQYEGGAVSIRSLPARLAVALGATTLGRNTFLGNHAVVPAGASYPSGLFIGVATVADASRARAESGWFGHPAMELPRREVVAADRHLTHEPSAIRYCSRVFWESLRFALPVVPGLVFLAWLGAVGTVRPATWSPSTAAWFFAIALPGVTFAALASLCAVILAMKWALLGRVRPGQHPLWSCWCSRWDFLFVAWSMYARALLERLEGTIFLIWFLRAIGMRIGRDVILGDGFAQVVDPDMLTFEDGATVTCNFQAHTFEDRILKIDHLVVRGLRHR